MSIEICKSCDCSCRPLSIDCIVSNCDIQDKATIEDHLFTKATSDLDDLLGDDCAEEFCVALSAAAEQAENNGTTDIDVYLAEKWLNVIKNKNFKAWYANKIQWHFLNGASISEIVSSKLIVTSKNDPGSYSEDFKDATEQERKRLQRATGFYVSKFKEKFQKRYWNKNIDLYGCIEKDCGCKKNFLCKEHDCNNLDQEEIGIWIG